MGMITSPLIYTNFEKPNYAAAKSMIDKISVSGKTFTEGYRPVPDGRKKVTPFRPTIFAQSPNPFPSTCVRADTRWTPHHHCCCHPLYISISICIINPINENSSLSHAPLTAATAARGWERWGKSAPITYQLKLCVYICVRVCL